MSEYLGEDTAAAHEAKIEALSKTLEDVGLQSKEISAAMQESDDTILGHRLYHEAPNDVFELIVLQLPDVAEDESRHWVGKGGLNALRLVSKRCLRVVESVATRLTFKGFAESLPRVTLKRCKRIEHIRCIRLKNLEGCPEGLKSLYVRDVEPALESLEPLSACKELETLEIQFAYQISDLSPLSSCTKLKELILDRSQVTDVTPLLSMLLLERLNLYNASLEDISPFSHCKNLKKLTLGGSEGVNLKDLSPLCQCPDLEEFSIWNLPLIKDLSFFEKGFTKLRLLDIGRLPVDDLSPLTRLKNLEELSCDDIPDTTSLLPLARCYKLKAIHCSEFALDLAELREKRPDLSIEAEEEEVGEEGEEEADDDDDDDDDDIPADPVM